MTFLQIFLRTIFVPYLQEIQATSFVFTKMVLNKEYTKFTCSFASAYTSQTEQ